MKKFNAFVILICLLVQAVALGAGTSSYLAYERIVETQSQPASQVIEQVIDQNDHVDKDQNDHVEIDQIDPGNNSQPDPQMSGQPEQHNSHPPKRRNRQKLSISSREKLSADINAWLDVDVQAGVPEKHRRRLLLNGAQVGLNERSALFFHGLYNSPAGMLPIADVFEYEKSPVLMARLAGHNEEDQRVLEQIEWRRWFNEAEADFALARRLGRKVVLVGHSTGALLATWLAAKNPEHVEALILFSPAFGVSSLARAGAWASQITGINPSGWRDRVLVGHAGLEVVKASEAFQAWNEANSRDGYNFVARRLSRIPIWMANTSLDLVIKKSKAKSFMREARLYSPSAISREEYRLSIFNFVTHDAITTNRNYKILDMKLSISDFLANARRKAKPAIKK